MKRESTWRAILSLVVTLGFVPAVSGQSPSGAPAAKADAAKQPAAPSDNTHSERSVRISWDQRPGVEAPDYVAALARLRRPDVLGAIGQEVLGVPPETAMYAMQEPEISSSSGDSIELLMKFELDPRVVPKFRPASREFADRVVARFTELLRDERREHEDARLAEAQQAAKDAETEYEVVVRKLREVQAMLGGQSPEGARAALAKLEDERQHLELELAGIQARQKAVGDWIDRATKQLEEQVRSDPVVAELEKAVMAQQKFVDVVRKQVDAGVANPSVVAEAESKLSDVRVQLLDRKRGGPGGGGANASADPLAALNRELQNLSIDIIDRKARLAFIEKRLAELQTAVQGATDYDLLESERQALRKDVEDARRELRVVRKSAQASPQIDRVILIRSSDWKQEQPKEGASQQ